MMDTTRPLVALLATALLTGCVVLPSTQPLGSSSYTWNLDLNPNAAKKVGTIKNVLALSSGGADGAFGAGVLVGWSESGKRPSFDIVTGVSTGALQAPLAFLGPAHDAQLRTVFTAIRTEDIFKSNGLGALIKTGISDADPLRRLLDQVLTIEMLDAIAAEHRKGRRLYVATTDLTRGRQAIWDMGALAASGLPNARSSFVSILVASASPPGFVEPVRFLDSQGVTTLHGDGGVKNSILVEPTMLRRGATLWIIANGHVSRETPVNLSRASVPGLARRGVAQLLRSLLYSAVERASLLSKQIGMSFRLQRLPDSVPEAGNPFAFNPAEMEALFETGRAMGQEPRSWLRAVEGGSS